MVKLVGTGGNQVPTNNMLGNMAFQNKEGVSADLLSLAAGTASAPSLIPSGDTNTGMWFPAADTVAISTNGGERLRVDNSGYVGIGTASPLTFLHVRGGAGGINSILDSNSSSDTRIEFRNNATRAGYVYWDTSEVRYFADTSRFSTFYTNASERVRITSAGDVGIGTASPSAKLSVTGGAFRVDNTLGFGATFNNTSAAGMYITFADTSNSSAIGTNSGNLIFYNASNTTERMRITNAGNVGIGTTTPSTKLDVVGGANVSTELDYNYTAASLPSAAPALDLNFAMSEGVDQRITFTRATTATFVGSNGLIQTAAANVPRIEYDPVTLECRGLLIEEQRTNLAIYSAQFDQADWQKASTGVAIAPVVTANAGVAPDGTMTADRVVFSLNGGTTVGDLSQLIQGCPYTPADYVFSVWLRSNTGSNQTVMLVAFNGQSSPVTVTPTWQRFTRLVTSNLTATSATGLRIRGTFTDNTCDILVWGAQLELGSFSTSYIPTTTVAVQRNTDVASIATSVFPYNATEGTLVANLNTAIPAATVVRRIAILSQGASASNSNQIYWYNSNIGGRTDAGGVTQADTLTAYTSGTNSKASYAFKANDFQFCKDGVLSSPDTSGSFPTNIDTMYIGSINGSGVINGWIRQIIYYSARLTNAQLQALTT